MKYLLNFILLYLSLYYGFIEPITAVYWIVTAVYTFTATLALLLAIIIWSKPSYAKHLSKQQYNNSLPLISVFFNLVIITSVLVYTQNYYHLLYSFVVVLFYLTLLFYAKQD